MTLVSPEAPGPFLPDPQLRVPHGPRSNFLSLTLSCMRALRLSGALGFRTHAIKPAHFLPSTCLRSNRKNLEGLKESFCIPEDERPFVAAHPLFSPSVEGETECRWPFREHFPDGTNPSTKAFCLQVHCHLTSVDGPVGSPTCKLVPILCAVPRLRGLHSL